MPNRQPDSCYEISATSNDAPGFDPLFPSVLHHSSLTAANEITLYNSILLLPLKLGTQILGPFFDASLPAVDLPVDIEYGLFHAPGSAPSAEAIATEICRSVEYHLLDSQNSAGAFFLLFPLNVAFSTFVLGSREAMWVADVMRGIADSSGFGIGHGLSGSEATKPDT
jgi:hypothetical protein